MRKLSLLLSFAALYTCTSVAQMQAPSQAGGSGSSSAQTGAAPMATMQSAPDAIVHPGDLVIISVLNLPSYNISTRLSEGGDASLPLLGIVHIGNMTVADVQMTIRKALLAKEILYEPQVLVYLQESQSQLVTILGGVKTPGPVPLTHAVTLPQLIGMAGGLSQDGGDIATIRTPLGKEKTLRLGLDLADDRTQLSSFKVYPGDTVIVRKAFIYYALGQLSRPGGYASLDGGSMTALRLCSLASGYKDTAAENKIRVIRKMPDGTITVIKVDSNKVTQGKQQDIILQPNDIVYVPNSAWKQTTQAIRIIAINTVAPLLYIYQ